MKKIVILGGGITGLVLAKELSDKYKDRVVVIEKEPFLGGLAATLSRDNLFFDLGSHRIHSDYSRKAIYYLTKVLRVKIIRRPRSGLMYFDGKFVKYPPNVFNFINIFSLKKTAEFAISYLKNTFMVHNKSKVSNYEEAVIKIVGKKIYYTFYKDFAKKLWGIDPKNMAAEGMRRRNTFLNLKAIRKNLSGGDSFFFYPLRGTGEIAKKLEEKILRNGAKIMKSTIVKRLELEDARVSKVVVEDRHGKTAEIESAVVVSTVPIDSLFEFIYGQKKNAAYLRWRGLRLLYLYIRDSLEYKNDTFYFPELDIAFGRISDISKFSPYMKAPGKGTLLTIEIPCSPQDKLWDIQESELVKMCVNDLIKAGLLKKDPDIVKHFSIHLEKAYPIYEIGWTDKFYHIYNELRKVGGLFTVGRKGLFLHCNIDHCIIQGLELSAFVLRTMRKRQDIAWNINAEKFMHFSARD